MVIVIPLVLSLLLAGTSSLIANSVLMISILLVRAGGMGVYAHPSTLTIYALIVGILLLRRFIEVASLNELKKTQETVEQNEQQLRALVASLDEIVFQVDEHGTYLNIWTADESLLAQPKDQLLGRRITETLGEEDGQQFDEAVQRVLKTGRPENIEYFLEVIGGKRWFNACINPILDTDGTPRTASMLIRDVTQRKQAEAELRASEERYRLLFEENPLPLWVYDLNSLCFLAVNDAAIDHYGYERSEFLNMTIRDICSPQELSRVDDHLHSNRQPQEKTGPWKCRKKDGTIVDVEIVSHETFFFDKPARIVLTNDITDQLKAKAALATSERRFRNLIENSADGITVVDREHRVVYVSPSIERLLGYSQLDVLGRRVIAYVHQEDRAQLLFHIANLDECESCNQVVLIRFKHKDGSWRWLESTMTRQSNESVGETIVFNYRDVTERKHAEEIIRQREGQMRALVSSLDDVVFEFNEDGCYLNIWAGDENLLILPKAQMLGSNLTDTLGAAVAGPFLDAIQRVLDTGNSESLEYPLKVISGLRWFWARMHPIIESDGTSRTVSMLVRDVTQRRQVEEELRVLNTDLEKRVSERTEQLYRINAELEHANRAKDQFLANMSHELRTPLNSILGLSESLLEQRRGSLNEHQQNSLHIIESSGHHLLELINDILDLSKIEAGKFDYYPETISIDQISHASLAFVKIQALKKSIKLRYESDPLVSNLYADPRRLKQILVNLLTNAVKFTPERGQVILRVHASPDENLVQFSVIDTGIGIAEKDLPKLFKPFQQVDSQLNRQFEGTGLGLTLVEKLTDLHGGSVHVQSEDGQGSCFTINLPWVRETAVDPAKIDPGAIILDPRPTERSSKLSETKVAPKSILLAEDNMANILTIGDYLETYGYQVTVAHDGIEALTKAEEIAPDLILMDIQMPGMNGLEAIAHLRAIARFGSTPIIALTALAMSGDRERCLQVGATEYMSKPVNLKMLAKTIESLLKMGEEW
jgi:PAS domain S-box-containing protein